MRLILDRNENRFKLIRAGEPGLICFSPTGLRPRLAQLRPWRRFKTVKKLMQHEKSYDRRFFVKGMLVDNAVRNTVARDHDRFFQRVEVGEVDLAKILTKPVRQQPACGIVMF